MHLKKEKYKTGYNQVLASGSEATMEVGKIILKEGDVYTCSYEGMERAFLLVEGHVLLEWGEGKAQVRRDSCFDENPVCLHVPKNTKVRITGKGDCELIMQGVDNSNVFDVKLYDKDECISEIFGENVLSNTSTRVVRTIIDDSVAPYSNLVIGEVINLPGKWSSYPPHHHMQPEVYMYRFKPEQGFGFSCNGETVHKVRMGDSVVLTSGNVHPQVAAPGYAMYYAWLIPHSPKRWMKDRDFLQEDMWLFEKDPDVWEPEGI